MSASSGGGRPPPRSKRGQHPDRNTTLERIQQVLRQYPDNGQIIKELLQNADDAKARVVKLLLDEAEYDRNSVIYPELAKYQGPALLAYNDARLEEDDWEGLRNILKSKKAEDSLKVGKFGLGFKSCFHISDLVSYVSDDSLAFLDPHERIFPDENDPKYKAYSYSPGISQVYHNQYYDQLKPFQHGIFGFGKNEIRAGSYDGTIFRFPLRQRGHNSAIDPYDEYSIDKMSRLLYGMQKDGHLALLFLKHVETIEFYHKKANAISPQLVHSVSIAPGHIARIRNERERFYKEIVQNTSRGGSKNPVSSSFKINLNISKAGGRVTATTYLIQQEYNATSQEIIDLIPSTNQIPLVGIALAVSEAPPEDSLLPDKTGHLFCFLPLPMEGLILTGLGVHVNAAFAVTTDRKNIKLPTVEDNRANYEREIRWNLALIKDVLPICLAKLANQAASLWLKGDISNSQMMRLFPISDRLVSKWATIWVPFYELIREQNLIVVHSWNGQKSLAKMKEVVFISEVDQLSVEKGLVLRQNGNKVAEIPEDIFEDFIKNNLAKSKVMVEQKVISSLRELGFTLGLDSPSKIRLLDWLLSGPKMDLSGMALIPLKNGTWSVWSKGQTRCYLSNENQEENLFENASSRFIDMSSLQRYRWKQAIPSGHLNVSWLNVNFFAQEIRNSGNKFISMHLEAIWKYLLLHTPYFLSSFEGLRLITSSEGMYSLDSNRPFLHLSLAHSINFPSTLKAVFHRLGVSVLTNVPDYIRNHPQSTDYVVDSEQFEQVLLRIHDSQFQGINMSAEEREDFRTFLAHHSLGSYLVRKLKLMPLFETISSPSTGTSVADCSRGISFTWTLNAPFEGTYLRITNDVSATLARDLGIQMLTKVDFLLRAVFPWKWRWTHGQKETIARYCIERQNVFSNQDVKQNLTELDFVRGRDGAYRKPNEYLDMSDYTCQQLFWDAFPCKFPSGDTHHLKELGMRSSSGIESQEIRDLANYIHSKQDKAASLALMNFLRYKSDPLTTFPFLREISWIVSKWNRPPSYPPELSWRGETHTGFAKIEDFVSEAQAGYCGSQKLVMKHEPAFDIPSVKREAFLDQFVEILNCLEETEEPSNNLRHAYISQLEQLFNEYRHEEEIFCTSMAQRGNAKWVLVQSATLVTPEQIVLSDVKNTLAPLYYNLPENLISLEPLVKLCGALDSVSQQDLLQKLKRISKETESKPLGENFELVKSILNAIYSQKVDGEGFPHTEQMLIPNRNRLLTAASKLAYDPVLTDEVDMTESGEKCHPDIPPSQLLYFGVKNSRTVFLEKHSSAFGTPFGQNVGLTTTLKRLLNAYRKTDIIKELMQNAEDAGATEMHIVLDERQHPSNKVFDDEWKHLQGPALLVYNNKPFTTADLEGIKCLGQGSKQDDPMTTGQYGVGLNSVYNITDTPTFQTFIEGKEKILVAFDPNCKYVFNASQAEPGRKFTLKEIEAKFPDVVAPYRLDCLPSEGTLFRLPLRTSEQALVSDIEKTAVTPQDIRALMKTFYDNDAEESLLFLKNLKTLKFSRVTKEGITESLCQVSLKLTSKCQNERSKYYKRRDEDFQSLLNGAIDLTALKHQRVCVNATTKKTQAESSTHKNDWCISLAHGFTESNSDDVRFLSTVQGSLKLLPRAGVAYSSSIKKGKLFCLLPFQESGLSFHINGHFALKNENRDNVADPKLDPLWNKWNCALLSYCIAPAHLALVKYMQRTVVQEEKIEKFIAWYYSLFPKKPPKGSAWGALVPSFYKLLSEGDEAVFPKILPIKKGHKDASIEWVTLSTAVFTTDKFWDKSKLHSSYDDTQRKKKILFLETLLDLDMDLVFVPEMTFYRAIWITDMLQEVQAKPSLLTQDSLLKFLRECNSLKEKLPCKLTQTPIKSVKRLIEVCEFALRKSSLQVVTRNTKEEEKFDDRYEDLPLLLTEDGVLRCLGRKSIFHSRFSDTVDCPGEFVHSAFLELFRALNQKTFETFFKDFDHVALEERLHTVFPKHRWHGQERVVERSLSTRMQRVWEFLEDTLHKSAPFYKDHAKKIAHCADIKRVLGQWCLFPCEDKQRANSCMLILLKDAHLCIKKDTEALSVLRTCCKYRPAEACKRNPVYDHLLGDPNNPEHVLDALLCGQRGIEAYREEILNFFNLKRHSCRNVLHRLVELPIFELICGNITTLAFKSIRYLVQEDIPPVNAACFSGNQVILSKDSMRWQSLFQDLGAERIEPVDVYREFVLPNFSSLSEKAQFEHLCYLGRRLSKKDLDNMRHNLQTAPLVRGRRAEYYHNNSSPLLKHFQGNKSLPKKYEYFNNLLLKCGLRTAPNEEEMLAFANTMSHETCLENRHSLVSSLLQTALGSKLSSSSFLRSLGQIKFIPTKATELQKALTNPEMLVSLANSKVCSDSDAILSWTRWSIVSDQFLPSASWCDCKVPRDNMHNRQKCWEDAYNARLSQCGCLSDEITPGVVVAHLQGVSSYMEQKLDKTEDPSELQEVYSTELISILRWLDRETDCSLCDELSDTPIFVLREERDNSKLLPPRLFCTSAVPLEVPYLLMSKMELHDQLQPFTALLNRMGTIQRVTLKHYAAILRDKFSEDEEATDEEDQRMVKTVYQFLIEELYKYDNCLDKDGIGDLDYLLLPDHNYCLRSSSKLCFVDDQTLRQRVNNFSEVYLLTLDSIAGKVKAAVENLPERLRPKPLSHKYHEDISGEYDDEAGQYEIVEDFHTRFEDEDFGTALKKLCYVSAHGERSGVGEHSLRQSVQRALSVHVKVVKELKSSLWKDGSYIENSEHTKRFFIKPDKDMTYIYIDVKHATGKALPSLITMQLNKMLFKWLNLRSNDIQATLETLMVVDIMDIVDTMAEKPNLELQADDARNLVGKLGTKLPDNTKRRLTAALRNKEILPDDFVCSLERRDEGDCYVQARVLQEVLKTSEESCHIALKNYRIDLGPIGGQKVVPRFALYPFQMEAMPPEADEEWMRSTRQEIHDLLELAENGAVGRDDLPLFLERIDRCAQEAQSIIDRSDEDTENEADILIKTREQIERIREEKGLPQKTKEPQEAEKRAEKSRIFSTADGDTTETEPYIREPMPNLSMAKAMLAFARHDLNSVENDLYGSGSSLSWAAYKILQACEKALKGKNFTEDFDDSRNHDLSCISTRTDARKIQRLLGDQNSLRYPYSGRCSPQKFRDSPEVVTEALEMAKNLIEEFENENW